MQRPKIDWGILRGAMIVLLASLLVSGGLVMGGYSFEEAMAKEFKRDQRRFLNISRKYLAVDEEEQAIREYLPRFQALERRGIVGEDQRLSWSEALRAAGLRLKVPSIRYSIDPQESYTPVRPISAGSFSINASPMLLTMGLLHEEDLFRLLDTLGTLAPGFFTVEECSLAPSGRGIQLTDPKRPNLRAECKLDWVTLQRPAS